MLSLVLVNVILIFIYIGGFILACVVVRYVYFGVLVSTLMSLCNELMEILLQIEVHVGTGLAEHDLTTLVINK